MIVLSQCWSCGLTLENISFQISLCARAYLPIINEKNKDIRRDLYGGKNKRFQEAHSFHCRIRNTSRTLFVKQIQKAVKNNLWSWHKLVGGLKIDTKYFTHISRYVGRGEELWASRQFSVFPFAFFCGYLAGLEAAEKLDFTCRFLKHLLWARN